MTTTSKPTSQQVRYHSGAYQFVFVALKYTQDKLKRAVGRNPYDEEAHISGAELLEGIRALALSQFGLMTITVFHHWGIRSTDDFGRIVFELVENGEMRKTDRDQLSDFFDVYDFQQVFDRDYQVNVGHAFRS
jgi:uncharacterized repeat protein (TIGR04138 family)